VVAKIKNSIITSRALLVLASEEDRRDNIMALIVYRHSAIAASETPMTCVGLQGG
jgi:hypothetical protein